MLFSVHAAGAWPVIALVYVKFTSLHYHSEGWATWQSDSQDFEYGTQLTPQAAGQETGQVVAWVYWGTKYKNKTRIPRSGANTFLITSKTEPYRVERTATPTPATGYEPPSLTIVPVLSTNAGPSHDVMLVADGFPEGSRPAVLQAHAWVWSASFGWDGNMPWVQSCRCFLAAVQVRSATHGTQQIHVVVLASAQNADSKLPWRLETVLPMTF